MGRPRKSPEERKLDGNPGKRAIPVDIFVPEGAPFVPDPELAAIVKPTASTKTLACYGNGSIYRAISAEAGTKHGLNPSLVIFDELAQAKNRELYDVLDTSMGAREEPLFITISTQSNDPEHILSKLIDDGLSDADDTTVCHLYAAEEDCDLLNEKEWKAANPALGDFRSYDELAVLARKAKRMLQVEEIARVTGVPRPLLMVDETSWGSGIQALGQFFVQYALNPWFEAWQQAAERSLLTGAEKDQYAVKFNPGALLRGSNKDQGDFFAKALGAGGQPGWMSPNEVRRLNDMPDDADPASNTISKGSSQAQQQNDGGADDPPRDPAAR